MESKICIKCKRELPLTAEYYPLRKSSKDGYRGECRECNSQYHNNYGTQYYEKNKQAKSDYHRAYVEKNKEKVSNYKKSYDETRKDENAAYRKQYKEINRERVSKYNKQWNATHKDYYKQYNIENQETISANKKQYSEINKERLAKYISAYKKAHRDAYNINDQKRRAIIKGLSYTLTSQQWEECKEHFSQRCAYCGKADNLAQDHVIPVANGGGYTRDNIVPTCKHCNSQKSDSAFTDWYPKQKFYSRKRERAIIEYLNQSNAGRQTSIEECASI